MRRFRRSGILQACLGLAGSLVMADGRAADVAVKALPPQPAIVDWTGAYVGVTAGLGRRENNFSNSVTNPGVPTGTIGSIRDNGGMVGAYAGYNWQFGRTVTGVEADFSVANLSGNSTLVQNGGAAVFSTAVGDQVRFLGTARARLGWLASDKVLLYGTAGRAWEDYDRSFTLGQLPTQFSAVLANSRFGWVAGAGVEAMLFGPHWIGRLEYLHYGFERAEGSQVVVTPAVNSLITAGNQSVDVLRAGLSYKFGVARPAEELIYKAPALARRLGTWTGFYLGVHGGFGWERSNFTQQSALVLPLLFRGGVDGEGWLAGGHAGHNSQYDRLVAGYELDFSAADIKSATTSVTFPGVGGNETDTIAYKVQYLGSLRGRLGWLPTESVLLYGTAGLAWERLQRTATQTTVLNSGLPALFTDVQTIDKFGWVAGLGIESALAGSNWIGRLEYLHYGFSPVETANALSTTFPGATYSDKRGGQSVDALRAGVSYRFGDQAGRLQAYAAMPAAVSNWTGFYLGGHAGYGWNRNDFVSPLGLAPTSALRNFRDQGFLGGGQAGYNWQVARAVVGFELDGSATGVKGSNGPIVYTGTFAGAVTYLDKINYLGTARARAGWLPNQNVLLYATAGLAWERTERASIDNQTAPGPGFGDLRVRSDRFGWVGGVGVETMLPTSNWIGRIEYLHYDFGAVERVQSFATSDPAEINYAGSAGRQTIDIIRTGLSYKFGPF